MLFSSPLVVGPLFLQLFVHLFTISLSLNFLFPCSLHRFLFQSLCGLHIVILIRLRSSFCSTVGAHLAFSTPIFILKVIRALVPVVVEVFVLATFVHFSSRSSFRSSRFSLLAIVVPSAFIPIFVSDESVPDFVSLFVPDFVPIFRRSNLRSTLCLILRAGRGSNFLAGPVGSTFIAHFPDLVPNSRVTSGSSSHPHVSPIRCTFRSSLRSSFRSTFCSGHGSSFYASIGSLSCHLSSCWPLLHSWFIPACIPPFMCIRYSLA